MKWKVIVGILIILVSLGLFREIKEVKRLNERIGILTNNNKAYELELLNFSNERISYKMTIAEINKSKDKVIEELNKTRKELGIKDRELNQALCFKTSIIDTIKVIIEYNDTSYIKKDSIVFYGVCDFDKEIAFNALTKLNVSLRGEELTTELNVSDRIKLFDYSRREWKEQSFFKRLIKFQWGKYTLEKYQIVNENELNKIKDFKVIKVI